MKKVCSLDFLNMQYFETDLKTADGITVIHAGAKVTPELILKLYFKDIYIDDSITSQTQSTYAKPIDLSINEESLSIKTQPEITMGIEPVATSTDEKEPTPVLPDISEKTPIAPSIEIPEEGQALPNDAIVLDSQPSINLDIDSKGPKAPELDIESRLPQQPLPDISDKTAGPKQALPDVSEDSLTSGPKQVLPDVDGTHNVSGPRQALPDMEDKSTPNGPRPASKFMDFDDDEVNDAASKPKQPYSAYSAEKELPPEPIEVNPVLKFDEQQAQKMAKLAVEVGKLLNFSGKDLDDLRDAALYCNRGVISFRKDDTKNPDFEVHKALESAQMAAIEKKISERAIETIRLHPNNYDSASFSLNQKIPHYHIIGIVYYYEKVLKKENSKMTVLDRMLQLGGNKFNIFVLHKFIRMMKDINE